MSILTTSHQKVIESSLKSYFENRFVDAHLANVGSKTRRDYRCAVSRVVEFLGRDPNLSELSDQFFTDLTEWLIKQGYREKRVQKFRQRLRGIGRAALNQGLAVGTISCIDPLGKGGLGNRRHRRALRGATKETAKKVARAAALFATGSTLAMIGEQLGVTGHAVHNWRGRYRDLWDRAYRKAVTRAVERIELEAGENAKLLEATTFSRRAFGVERALQQSNESIIKPDLGPERQSPTLTELVANMAAERALKANSIERYLHTIRTLERYMGKTLYADCFNRTWANKWLAELDQSKLAKATVAGYRRCLLSMWRAAVEDDLCFELPKRVRRIIVNRPLVDAWTHAEMNHLLASAACATGNQTYTDETTGESIRIANSKLWRLFIRVLWDTGLRPGDVKMLRGYDLSPEGVIILTQSKTGASHLCKLHTSTMELLAELKRPKKGKIIPWDKSDNARSQKFRLLAMEPAGLTGELYKIRKSSASDVELHYPGMGAVHLGHNLGRDTARTHYLASAIIAKNRPMPTELTGDLK